MKKETSKPKTKVGRKPKDDPKVYRYDIRLNEVDSVKFENLFDLSGYKYRGHFICDKVLNSKLKIIETNKSLGDYVLLLSQFRGQFKGIGNNYNKVLGLLIEQFGRNKALQYLYNLEKLTIDLVRGHQQVEQQIKELEAIWLQK